MLPMVPAVFVIFMHHKNQDSYRCQFTTMDTLYWL